VIFRTSDGSSTPSITRMAMFALVHGAWYGAWCWESLTPLLQRAGHDVAAMDLPCDDAAASLDTYADVVCAALDGCDDDVVLVGHSMGGGTLPLVAARRPVRHLIYVCGFVPEVGRSVFDQWRENPDMLNPACMAGLKDDGQSQTWVDLELARVILWADCDKATSDAAVSRLRPQAHYPSSLAFTLAELPSVRTTSVVCSDDRLLNIEWSRRIARDQLGADPVELPGSHSPFLSRPSALADVLLHLAEM